MRRRRRHARGPRRGVDDERDGRDKKTGASRVLGAASEPASVVLDERVLEMLDGMWVRVSEYGRHQLAVRSSSTVEDLGESSMAGRFTSVIGVACRDEFIAAVHTVLTSAAGAALADGVAARPMAVLVQRVIHPVCGGVMFGVDPISGDRRLIVVEVSRVGPEAVVGGGVSGALATLNRRGRIVDADEQAAALLPRRLRRRLVRLASRTTGALRPAPGRRVGRRPRWLALAAPDAAGHRRRRPGERSRPAARSRPVRGDVPATAPAARARPLARAGQRRRSRGDYAARAHIQGSAASLPRADIGRGMGRVRPRSRRARRTTRRVAFAGAAARVPARPSGVAGGSATRHPADCRANVSASAPRPSSR